MPRIVIVGARRRRQGIGEFVARAFHRAGVEVAGIVGTSETTVREAQQTLQEQYHVRPSGYTSLETALVQERPDIVAICSPYRIHREQLEIVAPAGCHCLCEKPLWWDENRENLRSVTEDLVHGFASRRLLLDLVTQWPCTLPAFDALHKNVRSGRIRTFEMILSPLCRGQDMIPDSVPHVWSLLYALIGNGEVQDPETIYPDGSDERMSLQFNYRHDTGNVAVTCRFVTTPERPRPAAYAINGHWIHRRIRLPDYAIEFECDGRIVAVEDPLDLLVFDFVRRIAAGEAADAARLVSGMAMLQSVAMGFAHKVRPT
jgi:hypothetical protein